MDRDILKEDVETKEEDEELEILESEVREAIKQLKEQKAPGADNISAELIINGDKKTIKILHTPCNNIFKSKKWPSEWIESILIPIPKKANSRKCSDFRTISLISHASKVLFKIIQRCIQPKIEEVLNESQDGFRRDRSTTEQITNIRNITEKIRDSQGYVFHNFIDFEKAFDRVWHKALWHTMKKFNIGKHLTELIKEFYEKAVTKIMTGNGQFGEWFKASVGVRRGCILSPILFNVFLERIMLDTLEGFDGGIRCGGMKFSNLRFADDTDLLAEGEEELQDLTSHQRNMAWKLIGRKAK